MRRPLFMLAFLACLAMAQDPVEPPFTAAEIAAATRPGRTYRFKLSWDSGSEGSETIEFLAVDGDSCTMLVVLRDEDGTVLAIDPPEPERVSFAELEADAHFPAADTQRSEASIEVPAGRFECLVYEVHERYPGGELTTTYWFAKELPGAPVKMVTRSTHGSTTRVLVEHTPGE